MGADGSAVPTDEGGARRWGPASGSGAAGVWTGSVLGCGSDQQHDAMVRG
jgi:hypothetical protein